MRRPASILGILLIGAALSAQPPARDAAVVNTNVPATMNAGQEYQVSVTMKNAGTETWTAAGGHCLGATSPQDNETWRSGRISLPSNVQPGSQVTFTFPVRAPAKPGSYRCDWRMLQEKVAWFGQATNVSVQVTGSPQPTAGVQLPAPRPDPNDPQSVQVFDTGAYVADGKIHTLRWKNPSDKPIKVVETFIWTGTDLDSVCDTYVDVRREADGLLLGIIGLDRYANFANPGIFRTLARPATLMPGEALVMAYKTSPMGGKKAHHSAVIFFVR